MDTDGGQFPSTDLEDCREVWEEELHEYRKETQKRQKQVEKYFEDDILVCDYRVTVVSY